MSARPCLAMPAACSLMLLTAPLFSAISHPGKVQSGMDITVIGYGSLMSGTGLVSSGALQVKEARIVALHNCRRGFAKLSAYGDRFAMDIEAPMWPLTGRLLTPDTPPQGGVEALALTVPLADACRLAKREGYNPAITQQLAELAQSRHLGLAEFLYHLHTEANHDIVAYRRRLFALTGFASPHYTPHPVHLAEQGYALVFLAPGFEGTGSDQVISIRQQTGVHTPMSAAETWQHKQNEDQLAYFVFCFLGGAHGLDMRDILPEIKTDPVLTSALKPRLQQSISREREHFLAVTSLTLEQYRQSFGEPEVAFSRSGLKEFLA